MADTKDILDIHARRRRHFIKTSGKFAVAAPAVALLLAEGAKPARAQSYGGPITTVPTTT